MLTDPVRRDQPWLKSHFPSGLLYPDRSSEGRSGPWCPREHCRQPAVDLLCALHFFLTQWGGKPALKERGPVGRCHRNAGRWRAVGSSLLQRSGRLWVCGLVGPCSRGWDPTARGGSAGCISAARPLVLAKPAGMSMAFAPSRCRCAAVRGSFGVGGPDGSVI